MYIRRNKKIILCIIALSCILIIGLYSLKIKAEEKDYIQSNNSSSQSEAIISTINQESKIADFQINKYSVEAYETLPDFPNEMSSNHESKISETPSNKYSVEAYETLPDFPNEMGSK